MGKTLIIAEKPSVATDLARVLGRAPGMTKFEKEKDWFESQTHIISSAVGHLLELCMPETVDGKKPKWNFESLPILPAKFDLQPIDKAADRLAMLKRLLKRADVTEIVNACDAGREGELIFRYIIQASGVNKPIRRMWMQSMTQGSILEAWNHLRSDQEMQPLADAAVCRSESDWLVGINGTRALTAFNSRNGGFLKTTVGRVQTPTLTILVKRQKEIDSFVSRTFWEVFGDFGVSAGVYRGRWFDESFRKEEDQHARAERLWDKALADAIKARCEGKTGIVEETKKPTKQAVPLLYDLTSLQREASNRFGFSARRTLQLAQSLYESHKVLTYPRTDSRFLPEDYIPTVKTVLKTFSGLMPRDMDAFPPDLVPHAGKVLMQNWVYPNKRIFDSSKVSDHFAIIPTGQIPKGLKPEEQKLFDMVTRRFIAVFYPAAEFEVTTRITRIEKDAFKTDGKILVVPGWLEVYGKQTEETNDSLVPVKPGEKALNELVEVLENATKPPPYYNEATLLSAMEGAGKLVEDEELAEAMSERGLGTPATRAAIIEGLIFEQYILRQGRDLMATPKGITLIDQLAEMDVEVLCSPQMTGEWEYKLKQMEQGRLTRQVFMNEIRRVTSEIVGKARSVADARKTMVFPELHAKCPICGHTGFRQSDKHFTCGDPECGFRIAKYVATRELRMDEAKQLLETKFVGPLTGFKNRFNQEFDAALQIGEDNKVGFIFPQSEAQAKNAEAIMDESRKLCPCPVCATKGKERWIYEAETVWACESVLKGAADACKPKAKLSRELCQFQIPREQAVKFFTEGKTDVIDKFISKKNRPFSAALKADLTGKMIMGWDFPPRAPRAPAADGDAPPKKKSGGRGGRFAPKKRAASAE